MAMVQPKSQKLRLLITHLGLLIFIAAIMFPLLMVIAISLREGNFATGSLIPDKISTGTLAAGAGFQRGTCGWSGNAASLPGPAVAVELGENRRYYRHRHRGALHHLRLRFRTNAFSVQSNTAQRDADFPNVSGGFVSGSAVCVI